MKNSSDSGSSRNRYIVVPKPSDNAKFERKSTGNASKSSDSSSDEVYCGAKSELSECDSTSESEESNSSESISIVRSVQKRSPMPEPGKCERDAIGVPFHGYPGRWPRLHVVGWALGFISERTSGSILLARSCSDLRKHRLDPHQTSLILRAVGMSFAHPRTG